MDEIEPEISWDKCIVCIYQLDPGKLSGPSPSHLLPLPDPAEGGVFQSGQSCPPVSSYLTSLHSALHFPCISQTFFAFFIYLLKISP